MKERLKQGFASIFVTFLSYVFQQNGARKPKESVFGFEEKISKEVLKQEMVPR